MSKPAPTTVNVDEAPEEEYLEGEHWGHAYQVLTPSMERHGRLGVNLTRLPPGRTACPFHYHQLEDEVFYVLSGRGWLRYGDELSELRPGDCVSCPAGSGKAHQIANPFDDDLVYLAIGPNDPNEVCVYPDSNKVMVRSLKRVGFFEQADYMEGEPARPKIFELIEQQEG
jgi:uncharacterized cupin superfamily protein